MEHNSVSLNKSQNFTAKKCGFILHSTLLLHEIIHFKKEMTLESSLACQM